VAEEPGPDIDRVIDEAYVVMEPGDVVVDPSGSYWGDTLRRFRRMRHRSLFYVDIAFIDSSSGPLILASGDEKGVELARPALEFLASPGRVIHAGGAGAAHYALAVCEGVRTALAHAQSEAQQLFEAFPNELRVPEVVKATEMGGTEPATRASWILDDAVRLEAAVPLMAQAVMLEMAAALEEHRSIPPPPRIGPFVHPDDIL
jgi:6-phosphogluconate dehydrogenase